MPTTWLDTVLRQTRRAGEFPYPHWAAGFLPEGRLDLFDLQPEMLDKARHNLEGAGFHDVGFHAGDARGDLPFPDGCFDVAFLAAVLGEVPGKAACIRSLKRVLRPGGLLVFVEGFPDPDRLSVPTLPRRTARLRVRELRGHHLA